MPTVIFQSKDARPLQVEAPDGGALADLCDEYDTPIPFSCRSANCGTCRIVVMEGASLLKDAEDEELDVLDAFAAAPPKQRLACQAKIIAGPGVLRVRPAEDNE